jgi:hypothetical protein
MIVYKSKKMFGGRVSVRSCHIDYITRMKDKLLLKFDGREMIITPKTPYTCDERLHRAEKTDKYIKKGEYYKLYDYVFVAKQKPIEETWDGVKARFEALGEGLRQKGLIK